MDRQKLASVRNFIKSENGRLTSLALPRDLSLGGSKQKKVYTPNLNVVRNKNKPKDIVQKLVQQRIKREKTFKNQRQDSSRYIQSSGVFSEGTCDVKRSTQQNVDRHYFSKEQDPTATMAVPKFEKNEWKIDKQEEEDVINTLLNNDNCSSESEGEYAPTILPLKKNKNGFASNYKVKKDKLKIKGEPAEIPTATKKDLKIKLEEEEHGPADHICFKGTTKYDDDNFSVSLLKMPDTFPGKGFTDDSDKLVDYTLNHMQEGQIGKILVRKSGKIEVIIGNVPYLIDVEENPEFFEQIMVLPEESCKDKSPSIGVMGAIDERYILSPSWQNLFANAAKKKCKKKTKKF